MTRHRILVGKVEDLLPTLDDESFDAVLSDPPYGLSFMNSLWDHGVPSAEVWQAVLRCLKPGAHMLAFGGTRTEHRLTSAIEDSGFEIRDKICWLYGSGFPKALSIGKAIDKQAGATREVVGSRNKYHNNYEYKETETYRIVPGGRPLRNGPNTITAPATPEAAAWEGHFTALKPAYEPAVLAMKPLAGTYAHNALTHGVAGLAIDACRIATTDDDAKAMQRCNSKHSGRFAAENAPGTFVRTKASAPLDTTQGRWPANLILDSEAAQLLDEQSGVLHGRGDVKPKVSVRGHENAYRFGGGPRVEKGGTPNDSGGASRFYQVCPNDSEALRFKYTAKVSTRERNLGMQEGQTNGHPTLKPIALTTYLARLLLPPYTGRPRRLLCPFSGAGSEMIGALMAGWDEVVGIEMSAEYAATAEARIKHWLTAEPTSATRLKAARVVPKPKPASEPTPPPSNDERQQTLFRKSG